MKISLMLPIVAVLTLACSAESGASGQPGPSSPPSDGPSAVPSTDAGEQPPAEILGPVVADAASRAGVEPSTVVVVSATAVEWSDGSLGCPEPGMLYTQALVSGFQIIVRAGERDLDYRVPGPGRFRLCERP